MRITRSITDPLRSKSNWDEKWSDPDHGLITAWEVGRLERLEKPDRAVRAQDGQLLSLHFKGGSDKQLKIKKKIRLPSLFGDVAGFEK
ncbi:hypothetical protein BH11CYA1_BH11CYA1_45500 [soil metagenome]